MKKPTPAEVLTGMIARRETELQRHYDHLVSQRTTLTSTIARAEGQLQEVAAGLALCHRRAAEQGRLDIL